MFHLWVQGRAWYQLVIKYSHIYEKLKFIMLSFSFLLSICETILQLQALLLFAGGTSFGCPENAGAAGTLYDAVLRSLIVNNHNISTNTETLLLEFPNLPLWTNVYIQNNARATVPLLWSRVQVCETQIVSLYR